MSKADRQGQLPPPEFYRDVIVALQHLYPGVPIAREQMQELDRYLIEQWRAGKSGLESVRTTCSCDGKHISLSPGARLGQQPKASRIALPPQAVQPGQLFGADELRDTHPVMRLKVAIAVKRAKAEVRDKMAEFAQSRRLLSRSEKSQARIRALETRYVQERDALLGEVAVLEKELDEFLQGPSPNKAPRKKADDKTPAEKAPAATPAPAQRPRPKRVTTPRKPAAPASAAAHAPVADDPAEHRVNAMSADFSSDEGL